MIIIQIIYYFIESKALRQFFHRCSKECLSELA